MRTGGSPSGPKLFGPPGFAYVYFIYGMYECVNLVAERDGMAGAVLIRALEPVMGVELMQTRRPGAKRLRDLASGPGKLTIARWESRGRWKWGGRDGRGRWWCGTQRGGERFEIAAGPRILGSANARIGLCGSRWRGASL